MLRLFGWQLVVVKPHLRNEGHIILSNFVATAVNRPHHTFKMSIMQENVLSNTQAYMRLVEIKMFSIPYINPTYPKLTVTRPAWKLTLCVSQFYMFWTSED